MSRSSLTITLIAGLGMAGMAHAQGPPPDVAGTGPGPTVEDARQQEQARRLQQLAGEVEALKGEVGALRQKEQAGELQRLRERAASFSAPKVEAEGAPVAFISGQRSLQAINPEISIMADGFSRFHLREEDWSYRSPGDRNGAFLRVLGFHFQSNLDPFSWTKICIGVTPKGVGLGEAYMVWNSILPQVSLTIGKFRQQFGIVNRWHVPGLDQFDFPLAMTTVLGPGGLNQTGLSLEWLMPSLLAHANLLTVQVTNGESGHLFSGGFFSIPSTLVHLKNYYDLTESTYLELGLTGMLGFNHHEGKEVATDAGSAVVDEDRRKTWLGGVDLTVNWEPLRQAKYASVTWRSELYYAHKEQAALADASPDGDPVEGLGAYSYLHVRFDDNWEVGVRGDLTQPFRVDPGSDHTWQVMPYVNWWQSHWVRLRLHYSHLDGTLMDRADDRLLLQATWAVGPHKHERY